MIMLIELAQIFVQKTKVFLFACKENHYRAKIFSGNFLVYYFFAILAMEIVLFSFFVYFPKNSFFADITKNSLITFANNSREGSGLQPLTENPVLDRAAYMKAQDMLKNEYFAHSSPSGLNPWYWFKLSGYNYRFAGENLAIGFLDSGEVHEAWLDSPSHKANILNNKYKEIGIAVLKGTFQGAQTTVVVQLFGSKIPVLSGKTIAASSTAQNMNKPGVSATAKKETPAVLPSYDKVLGASSSDNNFIYNLFSFIAYDYGDFLRKIIYCSIIFVILLLLVNFFLKLDLQHEDLLFKAMAFVILLLIFSFIDKEAAISIIPHNLAIF